MRNNEVEQLMQLFCTRLSTIIYASYVIRDTYYCLTTYRGLYFYECSIKNIYGSGIDNIAYFCTIWANRVIVIVHQLLNYRGFSNNER